MAEEGTQEPESTQTSDLTMDAIRAYIPEEYREEKFWDDIKDVPDFLKSYANQRKYIGQSVRIPGEDATPEDLNKFYSKLGRPEAPQSYQIGDIPDSDKLDGNVIDWFKQVAYDEGLNQKQFNNLVDKYRNFQAKFTEGADEQRTSAMKQVEETLRRADQWGHNYDRNLAYADRAIATLGDENLFDKIRNSDLALDPPTYQALMQLFSNVGKSMAEHGSIPGEFHGIMNKETAIAKIQELQRDPDFLDGRGARHDAIVDELEKLYQIAYQ